jgi:galactonate dehydratase
MRITAVETFVISNRRVLVKISTDDGGSGWGEPTLENWARPIASVVDEMSNYLLGKDPRDISKHWQVLARGGFYRGGPLMLSALAGIDQALWDLKARSLGVPIYELLGGAVRDRVRIYAHANEPGRTGSPQRAVDLVEAGYTLLKVAPASQVRFIESQQFIEKFVADLRELRAAIPAHVDFAVDLHGRFSTAMSRLTISRVQDLFPAFFEEPLRPEHSDRIVDVVRATTIPIATGERLYTKYEFKRVLEAGVAIVQPDLSHAGGITECFQIAALAEIYDAQIAPHCPLGPVALAACIQVDLSVPNFYAQECVIDPHLQRAGLGLELVLNPEVLVPIDGYIPRLTAPGLGITIDEDAVRSQAVPLDAVLEPGAGTWLYEDDGGFAEW